MALVPTEIHGFRVEMGVGVHPTKPRTEAMNVWLTPATPENARKMRAAGKSAIQGCAELSPDLALLIKTDPLGPEAEAAAVAALAECAKYARIVNEA